MNFFTKVKNSLYDPFFYSSLKEQKLYFSFRYFFSLIALLSVTIAFIFGVELAPTFSVENLKKLANFYPEELAIRIKSGVISTNVSEPYSIKENVNYSTLDKDRYANWVVIDTKNDFSVDAFNKYDTRVLVGKSFIVIAKNRGQFEWNDVSRMPDFSLSQARLLHWIDLIGSYHLLISLGLFVLVFLAFFGFFTLKLLGLLIIALIIFLIGKIKKVPLSYKNSYQVALHAITIPVILHAVFILANTPAPFLFFFSAITVVIAFVNIKSPNNISPENFIGKP